MATFRPADQSEKARAELSRLRPALLLDTFLEGTFLASDPISSLSTSSAQHRNGQAGEQHLSWALRALCRRAGLTIALGLALAATGVAGGFAVGDPMARSQEPAPRSEQAFLAENNQAMAKMTAGMVIKPSGDVDRDFVDMMVPHHQGAIDMAVAVLRYGRNPQVRRLAQEIIVTQQQEIAAMRLAVGEPLAPSSPAPTTPPEPLGAAPGMGMK